MFVLFAETVLNFLVEDKRTEILTWLKGGRKTDVA